jgi:hypothetical protein
LVCPRLLRRDVTATEGEVGNAASKRNVIDVVAARSGAHADGVSDARVAAYFLDSVFAIVFVLALASVRAQAVLRKVAGDEALRLTMVLRVWWVGNLVAGAGIHNERVSPASTFVANSA